MEIIKVQDLWKIYDIKQNRQGLLGGIKDLIKPNWRSHEAVKGINFSINQGESIGYIGPNGSGKSTTIKMLTGILVPTRGKVVVNGIEPHEKRKENAQRIGVVFGQRSQLWRDLAIRESFELFRHIYKIPKGDFISNTEMMFELLGLSEFESTPVRQLSLGQRMRAEIACAFFHDPTICYLDEPTIGLDIEAKQQIRGFLRRINEEKKTTIILTTHDMDDIEQVCKRLLLINKGEIIYDDGMDKFINRYGTDRILTIMLEKDDFINNFTVEHGEVISKENKEIKILFKKEQVSATQLIQYLTSRYPIIDCKIEEPKIEDLIRDVYQKRGK